MCYKKVKKSLRALSEVRRSRGRDTGRAHLDRVRAWYASEGFQDTPAFCRHFTRKLRSRNMNVLSYEL
jgi:hypothetical protein